MAVSQQPSPYSEAQIATLGVEIQSNSQMIQELLSKLTEGQNRARSQSAEGMQTRTALVNLQQPKHLEAQHQFEGRQMTFEQRQVMQQHQQLQQQRQPQRQARHQMHAPHQFSTCEQQLKPKQHAQNLGFLQWGPQQLSPHLQQHSQQMQQHLRPQHAPQLQRHYVHPEHFQAFEGHPPRHQEQHFQQQHPQTMQACVQQHVQSNSPVSRVLAPPPGLALSVKSTDTVSTGFYDDDGSSERTCDSSQESHDVVGISRCGAGTLDAFPSIQKVGCKGLSDESKQKDVSSYTTLMVRNIPPMYTEEMLQDEWSESTFDFLNLPRGLHGKSNVGYAFINMTTPEQAVAFKARWNKVGLARSSNRKKLNISFAEVQGLRPNLSELAKKIRKGGLETRGCHPIIMNNCRRVPLLQALQSLRDGCGGMPAVV